MINIIRAAFDLGVTFFDEAEAYVAARSGMRILGEASVEHFLDRCGYHVQVRLEHRPQDG